MDPQQDFNQLPEPVRLEDTITSQDVVVLADEGDPSLRDQEWILRNAAG